MDGEPIAAAVARCRKGDKPNVAPRSTKAAVNPNKAAFASRDIKTPFELEIKKAKPDRRDAAQPFSNSSPPQYPAAAIRTAVRIEPARSNTVATQAVVISQATFTGLLPSGTFSPL